MWKDFFYFPKSDRRGIIVLIVLILIINLGSWLYATFVPGRHEIIASTERIQEYEQFIASMMKHDSLRREIKKPEERIVTKNLFKFNPNTIDSVQLRTLGLNQFVTSNILKYRRKGGKFNRPEDVKKVYGLTTEEYDELIGWIELPSSQQTIEKQTFITAIDDSLGTMSEEYATARERPYKYSVGAKLDLNLSDTTELKKIPGIGSGIANGIVSYRKRLGGFYRVEQLQDLTYIPDTLNKWFFVADSLELAKMNLNRASVERLTAHPYLNFYQSKVIVEYRKKKGKLNDLKQLSLYEEFTKEDLDRLSPYIFFE